VLPARVIGANEKIRTGHIGIGAMGRMNLGICFANPDIEPIAVCDLYPERRDFALDAVKNSGVPAATAHVYHEDLLENKDIDAVCVSTPDHWHAIPVLMACDAGKHIYCEKPLATTVAEGRAMVDAVRGSGVVFQAGTMQRSGAHFQEAVRLVQEGAIGKVAHVETWIHVYSPPEGMGPKGDASVPEGLDWDRYLGWTPKVPFDWQRFHWNFRWYLDYSGGFMTDWGVHLIDIALWAMGEENKPRDVCAAGGKFVLTDDRTTPDTLDVLYTFDNHTLRFSNRVFNSYTGYERPEHAIHFYGTQGTLRVHREGYELIPLNPDVTEPRTSGGGDMNNAHWQNFVDCVRSGDRPVCDVEVCHNTSTVCHMGTAAWVTGARLQWDPVTERFSGGAEKDVVQRANDFLYRPYGNGWSLRPPYNKGWA
jgi:predicted dehydrogenase